MTGARFFGAESFPLSSFRRKRWRTQVFPEVKYQFVALLWPNIPSIANQCRLGDEIWTIGCIQCLAETSLILPQNFGRNFLEKKRIFRQTFASSKVWRVQDSSNWCISLELRNSLGNFYSSEISTGTACKFWQGPSFLHRFIAKIVKKQVSLTFVDSSKDFLSCFTNNKRKLGFVMPIGLSGEAIETFSGYDRL